MSIIPFQYEGAPVRVVEHDGEPWFVAKDVCDVLSIANSRDALARLDDDEKGVGTADTPGGIQQVAIISEPGVYAVAMTSRKPQAKPFVHWLSHDVIPSIRKRGVYATEDMAERMLADPDVMIRALTELKEERAKRAQLEAQAETDRPKVLFADAVSTAHTSVLVGDLAKILKGNGIDIGANRLFKILRDKGYLIRRQGSDWNMPTQRSMDLGLFKVKETSVVHSDGHTTINKTPKVTGKGQAYFVDRFLSGRINDDEAVA